ncbi:MAG TPA: hypothetical protein VFA10_28685 [Ktedonobacteraceae bacterium]|nr:hypothetical protein [Ktedonobacteraceae bacterium]
MQVELKDLGEQGSRKRVARLLRGAGISAGQKRRQMRTTESSPKKPVADNRLLRAFIAPEANTKWAGDIPGIETEQGWLYLAVILDLSSRPPSLVGRCHPIAMRNGGEKALQLALWQRRPMPGLLHHTDRGRRVTPVKPIKPVYQREG